MKRTLTAIGRFGGNRTFGLACFCSAALLFIFAAAVGLSQANRSRQILRKHHSDNAEWEESDLTECVLANRGRLVSHISMPDSEIKSPSGTGPRIKLHAPYARWGYVLNVAIRKADLAALPLLEFLVNDVHVGSFQVTKHQSLYPKPKDCCEIAVDASLLSSTEDNYLVIRNAAGGGWQGRVLLIPYGFWRRVIMLLLPLSAWALLLSALTIRVRGRRVILPALVFAVFFLVYYYTSFPKKMAPIGGFLWDDSGSFTRYIMGNSLLDDLKKHMLFLPVMHGMWVVMMKLCRGVELFAMAAAFASVAALNVTVAHLWFRKHFGSDKAGMLLTLLYGFSFSVWMYSSIVESYILSSLFVNLFVLSIVCRRGARCIAPHPGPLPEGEGVEVRGGVFVQYVLPSLIIILAGLAHPPLLILLGVLVGKIMLSGMRTATKLWLPILLGCTVVMGFVGGQGGIRKAYDVRRDPSVQREAQFVERIMGKYAKAENMTGRQAGNVALGQFAYAVGGLPYGHKWYAGWVGCVAYFRTVQGCVFALFLVALWLCAFVGLAKSRACLTKSVLLWVLVVGPYLLFFWYFNPAEMLLYSAPLMSLTIAWLAECSGAVLGERRYGLIAALALFTVVLNTVVLTTYC